MPKVKSATKSWGGWVGSVERGERERERGERERERGAE